ncbi:MAG: hypothetical protein ACYTHJ_06715 [Planctomycetota bacterium]
MRLRFFTIWIAVAGLIAASEAGAHFTFIVPAHDGSTAELFMSETLEPADGISINLLREIALVLRNAEGKVVPLAGGSGQVCRCATVAPASTGSRHAVVDIMGGKITAATGPKPGRLLLGW